MEKITADTIEDKLIEYNGLIVTNYDLGLCIDNYLSTLPFPDEIYKNHKLFNGLLLYIYNHVIKSLIPETYNNDYELLDNIFCDIYIPLCYRFGHIPTISNSCILTGLQFSYVYDIKTGLYKDGSTVNNKSKYIIQKWIDICNSELIDEIIHRNSIGAMFLAKVHGFREDNQSQITINVNVPQISEKQLSSLASGMIPEMPNSDEWMTLYCCRIYDYF